MRSDWLLPLCTRRRAAEGDDGKKAHPTQKPESLLFRCVMAASNPVTRSSIPSSAPARPAPWRAASAAHYVGLGRDPTYAAIARKRIAEIEPLELQDVTNKPNKRTEPRIAFGVLIEAGFAAARC